MRMLKTLTAVIFAAALPCLAFAQSSPNLTFGQVPTPAQWNSYFSGKQDVLGFTPMNQAGGVFLGRVVTAPPGASTSGLNLTPGSTPASPADGDLWITSAGIFARVNGATYDLVGAPCLNCALTNVANIFTASPQTVQGLTTTSPGWYAQITGDTVPRVRIGLNATDIPSVAFGPGSGNRDTFIERLGPASFRFGAPDAAAPVAQSLGVQNVVAGTSNTAGASLTINGSRGTGTGVGGAVIWQIAPAGSTGSSQNALVNGAVLWGTGGFTIGSSATDQGLGTLNVAGAIYNAGTAPTGTGGYVRAISPTITGTVAGGATFTNPVIGGASPGASGALGFTAGLLNWYDGANIRSAVASDTTQTLTNKTFNCANNICTVRLGSDVTGQNPVANGGTGQSTAAAARTASGLNIDAITTHGDSIYTILSTDRVVATSAAFTASRAWTLPAANSVNAGQALIVADFAGGVTASNTLVITRAGADTVNGGTTATIAAANGAYLLVSDGTSKWTAQSMGAASAGGVSSATIAPGTGISVTGTCTITTSGTCTINNTGVTSIGCGTGLTGGTITTTGTCAVSLPTASNVLGGDVALNNTANYFDGPSMAQGTSGTWWVSGTVTLADGTNNSQFYCKLWDGTTVIDSGPAPSNSVITNTSLTLSGFLASPAANIRISCRDLTTTAGLIKFNVTGNSKDSAIFGHRIQ